MLPFEAYNNYKQNQNTIYVAFSKGDKENEPIDYREIADYQLVYSNYNSRVMYNTLTPDQQQIYRIFEYALDNEYTSIFFDSRLIEDIGLSLDEIMQLYSIDSPMMQQNYSSIVDETGYTFSYFWGLLKFEVTGKVYSIEIFSHENMQKKKEAIKEADRVFASMPKGLSQLEQARFFFRYLTTNVKYTDNTAEPNKQNNLYDAFVLKKTHCDGYANAFSLLCAMAKIPCAEKVTFSQGNDGVGHTWNVFCADGVWYNTDLALSEDSIKIIKQTNVDFSFGFSDLKTENVPNFYERFPVCNTDLVPVEFMVSSPSDYNLLPNIKNALEKGGKLFVHFGLENGELTSTDMEQIANYIDSDIYVMDEIYGGKYYYYIFKD